jgi:hypothetical protein
MWIIYLEMGIALALAILIVWWTWPKKGQTRRPDSERKDEDPG